MHGSYAILQLAVISHRRRQSAYPNLLFMLLDPSEICFPHPAREKEAPQRCAISANSSVLCAVNVSH